MITNPIISGFNPDPVICRNGEDYYIATSTFEWFPGVRIYHSRNLANWNLVAQPLTRVSQLDMRGIPNSGGVWAPCLSFHDGLFWLVYSNVKSVESPWKCGDNFLVTATNIKGPWSEPIRLKFGGFDPSLFHDNSGRKYMIYRTWGPRHHSNPHNNIVIQEYFHDQQQLADKRQIVFTGTHRKLTEGPHLYHLNDYYYLLVAEGGTEYQHAVTVLRSKNVDGPFELHPDETILSTANAPGCTLQKAGHGALIQTHEDEWYIVFLVGRPLDKPSANGVKGSRGYCPLGRETAIDKIEWKNDWPYVVNGPLPKLEVAKPSFGEVNDPESELFIDTFDAEELHPEWQTLRVPFRGGSSERSDSGKMGSVNSEKPGLRLFGREPLVSQFIQSTIGHRWKHFRFDAITSLSFEPKREQQNAGLACFYNTQNWVYCFVDFDESIGARTIKLIQVDNGEASYFFYDDPIELPNSTTPILLKVSVREENLQFHYSLDSTHWDSLSPVFGAWKLSDDHVQGKGFFTGAFVCLHCSDLGGEGIHADFHRFEYRPY